MASILFNIAWICNSQFKCIYLKNEKFFRNFLFHFWTLHQILNILKKKVMVLLNVFSKLQTVKNFVTPLCKKRHFGTRLDSWHVKGSRILAKSPWECFYQVFSSIWGKLIREIFPLGLVESKGRLLTHWVPMASILFNIAGICNSQLKCIYLKNGKIFCQFSVPFLESTSNFKNFEKKDDGLS